MIRRLNRLHLPGLSATYAGLPTSVIKRWAGGKLARARVPAFRPMELWPLADADRTRPSRRGPETKVLIVISQTRVLDIGRLTSPHDELPLCVSE